jgi:hypothetical protein
MDLRHYVARASTAIGARRRSWTPSRSGPENAIESPQDHAAGNGPD